MNHDELIAANVVIDETVFGHFASASLPLPSELARVVDDIEHPIHSPLVWQLSAIDSACVDLVREDSKFTRFHGQEDRDCRDSSARIWALELALRYQIPARRLTCLRGPRPGKCAPAPLDHPALAGLAVSEDLMVPLADFTVTSGELVRNGFAFTALAPVESSNSQYWYLNVLCTPVLRRSAWVRLDPLLVRPADAGGAMGYKVWIYGRPLDWPRLRALREEEHGQWLPGRFARGMDVTEFAWTPRDGMVHFRCEELPDSASLGRRGSRYFHAIYDPGADDIVHLDAAIRVYDADSWRARKGQHVRNAGKVGQRHKVFRVEGRLGVDQFCNLAANFFMWNSDVQRYFGADIPEDL